MWLRFRRFEKKLELIIFASRWLLAPVYIGLIGALFVMLYVFVKYSIKLLLSLGTLTSSDVIVAILSLIDVVLVMNLIIIIIFSGYENFVSKMEEFSEHKDRPEWMGHVSFSDIKVKLFNSLVAITGIEILKSFLHIEKVDTKVLLWQIILHGVFVVSSLFYAISERIYKEKSEEKCEID